jgi:hypothetical protein
MATRKFSVPALTNGSGAGTVYTPFFSGYLESIQYLKTDFANGADFTVTADVTGEAIWSATDQDVAALVRPRAPTHSTAGVAAVYASGGTAVNDRIALDRDRIKFVIAQGGANKSGTFVVTVSDR